MAEEKEPLDNSRLGKSKRKLVRLQNELNDQIEKMFEHQRTTGRNDLLYCVQAFWDGHLGESYSLYCDMDEEWSDVG